MKTYDELLIEEKQLENEDAQNIFFKEKRLPLLKKQLKEGISEEILKLKLAYRGSKTNETKTLENWIDDLKTDSFEFDRYYDPEDRSEFN